MDKIDWRNSKPVPGYTQVLKGIKIDRGKIKEYFTADVDRCLDIYYKYKKYGWPFRGGWADQPAKITKIVFLLDRELEKWQKTE